ncbi:hypothetical protein AAHH71_04480 [Bacillus toyonensis]
MKKKVVPVVASVLGASLLLTACGEIKIMQAEQKQTIKHLINKQLTYHLLQKFQQWMLRKQRMGNP